MWKMKTAVILVVAIVLFLITPIVVFAHGEIGGMVMVIKGYTVRLILPDVVRMGENQFQVLITGVDGLPVSGVQVEVAAQPVSGQPSHSHDPAPASTAGEMAGMPGMDMSTPAPVMERTDGYAAKTVKLTAAPQAGLYQGAISFSKEGAWALTVHLMIGSEMLNVEFPLEVAYATPAAYGIIAAFLSLNIVILASAAVLRVRGKTEK